MLLVLLVPFAFVFPVTAVKYAALAGGEARVEVFDRENIVLVPLSGCKSCVRQLAEPRRRRLFPFLAMIAMIGLTIVISHYWLIVGIVCGLFSFLALVIGVTWLWRSDRNRWQQSIIAKLREVPVYAQLIKEYPHAIVMLSPWYWVARRPRGRISDN
jgi:hypothetical protein